jgi:hypothetical protein
MCAVALRASRYSCYYAFTKQQKEIAMSTYFDWEGAQESTRRQLRASILTLAAMTTAALAIGFLA